MFLFIFTTILLAAVIATSLACKLLGKEREIALLEKEREILKEGTYTYEPLTRKNRCRSRKRWPFKRCQLNRGHRGNHLRSWIEGTAPHVYYADEQWR